MNMDFIVPGWSQFLAEPQRIQAKVMDRSLDHEEEAWRLGDYIPSTYLQDGIRHIVVFDLDEPIRYTYDPVEGLKQVKEVF